MANITIKQLLIYLAIFIIILYMIMFAIAVVALGIVITIFNIWVFFSVNGILLFSLGAITVGIGIFLLSTRFGWPVPENVQTFAWGAIISGFIISLSYIFSGSMQTLP